MPRSAQNTAQTKAEGLDVDFAQFIAKRLVKRFVPVWSVPPTQHDTESTDISLIQLLDGQCDIQMSIPGSAAIPEQARSELRISTPYYGTRFELLLSPHIKFADWKSANMIAVQANSIAHIYVNEEKLPWSMKQDSQEIIDSFRKGESDAAFIWGPDLAAFDISPTGNFKSPAILQWNQHIVTRAADAELRTKINDIIADPETRRKVESLLAYYHIPSHAPFRKVYDSSDQKKP